MALLFGLVFSWHLAYAFEPGELSYEHKAIHPGKYTVVSRAVSRLMTLRAGHVREQIVSCKKDRFL